MKKRRWQIIAISAALLLSASVFFFYDGLPWLDSSDLDLSGDSSMGTSRDSESSGGEQRDSAEQFTFDEDGNAVDSKTGESVIDPDSGNVVRFPEGALLPEDGSSPYVPMDGYETKQNGLQYERGRLSVEFNAGVSEERMRAVVTEVGCTWGLGSSLDDYGTLVTVGVETGNEDEAVNRFITYEEVRNAWRAVHSSADQLFNNRLSPIEEDTGDEYLFVADDVQQFHLHAAGFRKAWTKVKCNGTVTIAVLDSGKPKPALSDLECNIDYDNAYDAVYNLVGWGTDGIGHGTSVAGIVSGIADNNIGVDGVSYNATVLPIRICLEEKDNLDTADINEGPTAENLVRGLKYLLALDDVPEVVNMSFGISVDDPSFGEIQSLLFQLRDKGTVVVAAAGNIPDVQSYPASFDGVVSVGALGKPSGGVQTVVENGGYSDATVASYSSVASSVDLCAFGDDICVLSPAVEDLPGFILQSMSGTSFAAPQVAGAAALIKAQDPTRSADEVEHLLFSTAICPVDFSDNEGGGALGDEPDGKDDMGRYGYGALDAAAAVGWVAEGESGRESSPFTGASDGSALTQLQIDAQERIQSTNQNDIQFEMSRISEINPDVCGWLYVPGTDVCSPIAWSTSDNDYYLRHDAYGYSSSIGCPYVSSDNSSAFSCPITVIYGHSFNNSNLAFTTLHRFENKQFFEQHNMVYVYLPDKVIKYTIIGANLFNARAIEDVNQNDDEDLSWYFAELSDPDPNSFIGFKRAVDIVPGKDRVVQLSTCTVPSDLNHRFVITALYCDEQAL